MCPTFAVSAYQEGKLYHQPNVYNTKKIQANLILKFKYHSRLHSKSVAVNSGGTFN